MSGVRDGCEVGASECLELEALLLESEVSTYSNRQFKSFSYYFRPAHPNGFHFPSSLGQGGMELIMVVIQSIGRQEGWRRLA